MRLSLGSACRFSGPHRWSPAGPVHPRCQGDGKQVRWYALGITLITFLITVAAYLYRLRPEHLSGLQLSERVNWLPDLGLTWAVGADGLSMPLILLTSFITSARVSGRLAGDLQATSVLFPAPRHGWRPDRCVRGPGHAAVLPGLGA